MSLNKEKNPLPFIIAIACFIVLFILMKAQDVRTEEARVTKEPNTQKRQTASGPETNTVRSGDSKKTKN